MKSALLLSSLVALVSASPVEKRTYTLNDGAILNYALTLEHLEDTFYREGLARFSQADFAHHGFDSTFYHNLKEVSLDESTHVSFLTTALQAAGVKPVAACTYNFGVTDVKSFVQTASILEGVGVSAYLGAAASIMNKNYLTAAGSILTVEARHSSYIRGALKELPFAQPFDAPLTPDDVYSLAAGFIVKCPSSNPKLPVKAFPTLTAKALWYPPIVAGSEIELTTKHHMHLDHGKKLYAAFVTVTGPIFVPTHQTQKGYKVTVPKGVNGQSYVVLTCENTHVSDDTTLAIGIVEIDNPTFIPA